MLVKRFAKNDAFPQPQQIYLHKVVKEIHVVHNNNWLTLGMGSDRSQNGSKVTEVWPQSQHFNILFNCPTKRSEKKRENEMNALSRLTYIRLLITEILSTSYTDILLARHAFLPNAKIAWRTCWPTSHQTVITWKIIFPRFLCILMITKKKINNNRLPYKKKK